MHAAARAHVEVARVLIEQLGADCPRAQSFDGSTPLHMAADKGHVEVSLRQRRSVHVEFAPRASYLLQVIYESSLNHGGTLSGTHTTSSWLALVGN